MEKNQEMEYVSLKTDILFHMVFTKNEKALKGLLSALLNIPVDTILKVEVLNPMQYSDVADSKLTVLDLKLHLNDEKYVLVEMQVRKFPFWTNRTVGYAGRQIADQIHDDFDYSKLEPVVQISIMDYTLFPDHKVFYNEYWPQDRTGYTYTDRLKFLVMDLSAISDATDEQKQTSLVEWARAFRAESWDEVNKINDSGVKEAAKTMELIMSNPTEREWIRMRRDAEVDRRTEERGARLEIAKGLKQDGIDPTIIARNTGLSIGEIANL